MLKENKQSKKVPNNTFNYLYKSITLSLILWVVGCTISLPIFDSAEEVFRRHGILDIYATNIIISNGDFILIKQEDFDTNGNYSNKLSVQILPHDHKEKNVFWESSHTNALQVFADGTILSSSNITGAFTITIKVRAFSNSIDIVIANPTTNLSVDTNDFDITANDTGTLTATLSPPNHTDTVYWISSDTNIIVINPSNGGYTPSSLGDATITALALDREGGTNASNSILIGVIPPANITNQFFSINEDVSIGTIVGTVSANLGVTNYAITMGNSNNAFTINPTNGRLTTAINLNYGTFSNYSLIVRVMDSAGNTTNNTVIVTLIDILEWQTRHITNTLTNEDLTTSILATLNQKTSIDELKRRMFAWMDVSIPPLLITNSSGRLTNWIDKKSYVITGTNTITSPTLSVTTNTNSAIQIISNERVAFTNIVASTNIITVSLNLTNAISATPKSDLGGNDSLSLSNGGTNGYVVLDYEGSDRVGFAIDTTSMGISDNITAFYLVTEWVQGNNNSHVPLGYDDLGNGERFFTKRGSRSQYIASNGNDAKGNIVSGDSVLERNADFAIPSMPHLISRRGLAISKSDLNGMLGSFPTSSVEGGEHHIREIIIFTNTIADSDHSNIVAYFYDKWNLTRETVITNLTSHYSASGGNTLNNAVDGNASTYFRANNSAQQNFTANTVLFQSRLHGSVLDGNASSIMGLSAGHNSLYLRTGLGVSNEALRSPFKVELYRTNDNSWFVLSNIALDASAGDKTFLFPLDHASNDFDGYRIVANGAAPGVSAWFIIDEFGPVAASTNDTNVPTVTNHTFTTRENLVTNILVGVVRGMDDGVIASYAITAGNSNTNFQIDDAGVIRTTSIIDYESISNYLLIIRATDSGGNSGTGNITVNVIDGIDLNNTTNVLDDTNLELSGAISATTAKVGEDTYLFVTGYNDDGVSVFSVESGGLLVNITNVTDGGDLELDEARSVTTAKVGGTTYLFVAGHNDDGVSVFSVESGGLLVNITNVTDGGDLELDGASSVTTAKVGGTTYLFVTGYNDDGVSVFSVESGGLLVNITNVTDGGDLELDGASSVTTANVGGTTYLFVSGRDDNGVSVFSVGSGGSLDNVANVMDGGDLLLDGAVSLTTAEVGGTNYLFVAGYDDNGVSVFWVGSDGTLSSIYNISDGGDLELLNVSSLTITDVGGTNYLFAAGLSDNGMSVFSIGNDGSLDNVLNVPDGGDLLLGSASFVNTVEVDGTTYLFVASLGDSGVSVFEVDPP